MDVSMTSLAARPAPEPRPDLRPAADAAATQRLTRTALPAIDPGAVPPSPLQAALVGRSLLEAKAPGAVEPAQRVLKPWGIGMLPHRPRDEGVGPAAPSVGRAADPTAGQVVAADPVAPAAREA